ncbi:MAG: fasciclin domain-containing protein, partial [Bacteroidaceae bacterium]|nr:fasciclin domain-containing protein [Bacteroidaceae bacterium]
MKKPFGTKMKVWALGALAIVISGTFTSCKDEIPEGSRFTFKGELISDHLQKNPEYSSFCKILEKAKFGKKSGNMLTALSTYGAYTCFAPTDSAIQRFLVEKHKEYLESVELHKKDTTIEIKKGITSPYLEDLSDSMALVIAKNHIIEKSAKSTTEIVKGPFPGKTMSRRIVELDLTETGEYTVENIMIEKEDIETENGYIHRINGVLSPSDDPISTLLASQPGFSLFCEALKVTGFDEYLKQYITDTNYDPESIYVPAFSTEGNQTPPCPETNNKGFTLLVETDSLFADPTKNASGEPIYTIEDLEKYAARFYGDTLSGKYSDPNNPLYKFIAYHIIDRRLIYKGGAMSGSFVMENHQVTKKNDDGTTTINPDKFDSEENLGKTHDRYDYFETALPFTLLKVTKPLSNSAMSNEIVLNYAQEMGMECINPDMSHHINVIVESTETASATRPKLENFTNDAVNGTIFTIDKILIYNEEEMSGNILN